jgi:hypothetical protein
VSNVGNTCEMVNCNVLNDVSKCYYVAEMDEISINQSVNLCHVHMSMYVCMCKGWA